jgi:hypothetical protein
MRLLKVQDLIAAAPNAKTLLIDYILTTKIKRWHIKNYK